MYLKINNLCYNLNSIAKIYSLDIYLLTNIFLISKILGWIVNIFSNHCAEVKINVGWVENSRKNRKILSPQIIRQKICTYIHFVSYVLSQTHKFVFSERFIFRIPAAIWQVCFQTYRQSIALYFKFEAMTIYRMRFFSVKFCQDFQIHKFVFSEWFRFLPRFDKFFFLHIGNVFSYKKWQGNLFRSISKSLKL